jgi:hypothetical protein
MPVTEPPDEIDSWLGHEVDPLSPSPGTFDRIHRRARLRKRRQALLASAGAVVVIAGGVLVPTVGAGLLRGGSGNSGPALATGPSSPRAKTSRPAPAPRPSTPATPETHSATQVPEGTGLSATSSGTNPPANFQPTSITMISSSIGAVIGQAGTAGHCAGPVPADCTSLAGTSSFGASWYGVSAPVVGVPAGSIGTSQLRFLNLTYGWAFGPELYATRDGGRHWAPLDTYGQRVTELEAAGDRAFAVLATCLGEGPAYASRCSSFSLYSVAASTPPGATKLRQVPLKIPAGLRATAMSTAGQGASASIVIAGNASNPENGTGYLLTPGGDILRGSVGGGAWSYVGKAPCAPGAAAASGSPLGAQLTVGNSRLLLSCASLVISAPPSAAQSRLTQGKQLYQSADGSHWSKVSQPPAAGAATSLASASTGQVVQATTAGIAYSADGTTWRAAAVASAPAGGFSYVGMTTAARGIALPADARLGEVFTTQDGGQTWSPSPIVG